MKHTKIVWKSNIIFLNRCSCDRQLHNIYNTCGQTGPASSACSLCCPTSTSIFAYLWCCDPLPNDKGQSWLSRLLDWVLLRARKTWSSLISIFVILSFPPYDTKSQVVAHVFEFAFSSSEPIRCWSSWSVADKVMEGDYSVSDWLLWCFLGIVQALLVWKFS